MAENGNGPENTGEGMPDFMKASQNSGDQSKSPAKKEVKKEEPKIPETLKTSSEIEQLKKIIEEQAKRQAKLEEILLKQNLQPQAVDMGKIISDVLSAVKKEEIAARQTSENAVIDPEDFLDKPVTYFCYSTFFVLGSDKRRGKEIMPPNGVIQFILYSTKVIQDGKGQGIINYAVYASHSKKEVEWLDNHTAFGSKFFKWDTLSDKTDPIKAKKFIKFHDSLKSYSPVQLKDLCLSRGIKFNPDELDKAKFELIMAMTDEELKKELAMNDTTFNQQLMMDKERFKQDYELYKDIR